jgi:hypothetical protein
MRSFLWYFSIYAVSSVLATLTPYLFLDAFEFRRNSDVFILAAAFSLIWIGPAIVLVVAIRTKDRACVIGALSGIPLMLAFYFGVMLIEGEKVRALDQRSFLPAEAQHDIIAIENSIASTEDGFEACQKICEQILLSGRYLLAVDDRAGGVWRIFQLAQSQACETAPMVRQLYAKTCIVMTYRRELPNAIVVRENYDEERSEIMQTLGHRSHAFELLERTNGQERLLGRWVHATVWPASDLVVLWGLRELEVGEYFDPARFYAAALNVSMK